MILHGYPSPLSEEHLSLPLPLRSRICINIKYQIHQMDPRLIKSTKKRTTLTVQHCTSENNPIIMKTIIRQRMVVFGVWTLASLRAIPYRHWRVK